MVLFLPSGTTTREAITEYHLAIRLWDKTVMVTKHP